MRAPAAALLISLVLLGRPDVADARLPWPPRKPPVKPGPVHQLRAIQTWPAEPDAPATIDPQRFRDALADLCGDGRPGLPADVVLAASDEAQVDPFLLAAVAYERSGCGQSAQSRHGYGPLRLHPSLYRRRGAPPPPGDARDWRPGRLRNVEANLRLGARLLAMWHKDHAEIDVAVRSVPHRSAVAHLYWGDRVLGTGHEDLVLTARRRLLARYLGSTPAQRTTALGVTLVPPLDAPPRVATSGPGEDRAGGARRHRGVDLVALEGEPVRAVADGTVLFAGVSLPGARRTGPLAPHEALRYRRRRLGPGGLYLCVRHDGTSGGPAPVSCYMHLSSYTVSAGDQVRAGQKLGEVGSTGVPTRYAHLHFELRHGDRALDACRFFPDEIIPPRATEAYHRAMAAQRARLTTARRPKTTKPVPPGRPRV